MSVFIVRVDGADITEYCLIGRMEFTAQANGNPGTARIEVSDRLDMLAYHAGQTLTLDIDGVRAWTGWVMAVRRAFHASVVPTRGLCEGLLVVPRILVIEGVDLNILFSRRVVWDHDDPTDPYLESYAASTPDSAVIADLAGYLDVDGIDMTTKVDTLGTIGIFKDIKPAPFEQGQTFGDAMRVVAAVTGAVYYIDPDAYLVYADVDGLSSPLVFTDHPTGGNDRGYRELEILGDATKMVNDMFVWGTALGVDHYVFSRVTDQPSINAHGRWQHSDIATLYHQAYVDERAHSFVYGTQQSKRGAKDERISVKCAVFNQPVRVAERYTFESEVFGFSDVIPIRQLRITFPTKTDVRYDILASHEIDLPWSFWESKWPRELPGDDEPDTDESYPPGGGGWALVPDVKLGVILDSFSRSITPEFAYHENGTPNPDYWPVEGTYGLGTGEYLTWAINAYGSNHMTGVTDGRGVVRIHSPYFYSSFAIFDGYATESYGATAPLTIDGVTPNYANCITKFRFGRDRRMYTGSWAAGASQPLGIPAAILANALDLDAYGRPDISTDTSPGLIGQNGVTVTGGWLTMQFVGSANAPGADPTKWWAVVVGDRDDGTWIHEHGGGLLMNYASNVWARMGNTMNWFHSVFLPPLRYGGHLKVAGLYFVGPDMPGMDYPWRIRDYITTGSTTVRFNRFTLPISHGDPFTVSVDTGAYSYQFATGNTASMVIEPDRDYWMRTNRLATGIAVTIWPVGSSEPATPLLFAQVWNPDGSLVPPIVWENALLNWNFGGDIWHWNAHTLEVDMFATAPSVEWRVVPIAGGLVCENATGHTIGNDTDVEARSWSVSMAAASFVSVRIDGIAIPDSAWKPDPDTGSNYIYIFPVDPPLTVSQTVQVCYYPVAASQPTTGAVVGEPDYSGPVYRPGFVPQFGWGTSFDGYNCTMASGCMALDRHTLGSKTSTPPLLRGYQSDQAGGTDLGDVDDAWHAGYDEDLNVVSVSWSTFVSMLNAGRGAVVQGTYSELGSYRCQSSFTGGHAVYVNEQRADGDFYVGDPLCSTWKWVPESYLRNYAETFGGGSVAAGFTRIATG